LSSRTTLIVLVISVTINLLVAGAIIGHLLKGGPAPRFPNHLGQVLEDIDPQQQANMKQQFRKFRRDGRDLHQTMRQQQRSLSTIILQDPFNEEATRVGFEKLRVTGNNVQAHMHDQMILAMKNLSAEDRTKLIRRLLRSRRGEGPPRHTPQDQQELRQESGTP
jgi:uncharacterized membrane protein